LVYAGVIERHYSARVLPRLSELTVTLISPGDEKRLVKRFTSQCRNIMPCFCGARPDDPAVFDAQKPTQMTEGETYEKAA